MNVIVVVGTRPCIIKQSPVFKALKKQEGFDVKVLHTDQHFDDGMDGVFLRQFGYENVVRLKTRHAGVAAQMRDTYEFTRQNLSGVDLVVVYGDTMSAAMVAMTAKMMGLQVAHVEAGCRSFDVRMPEENYRCMIDAIADYHFCPTEIQKQYLKDEGHDMSWVVGNTIQDVVWDEFTRLGLSRKDGGYALATAHRPENVDDEDSFLRVVLSLSELRSSGVVDRVVWPAHPRVRKMLDKFSRIVNLSEIDIVSPMSGEDFLKAMVESRVVVTDSGGIQEETYILGVPCVTIRHNTERPETLSRCNVLCDLSVEGDLTELCGEVILKAKGMGIEKPYGDWRVGDKIGKILVELFTGR